MSKICDKSVFVIFRPINTHYCHSRGCTLQHNLHSVFSQRPCSPDTYFAMQCYSRVHYFALYFSCIFNLKRIGSQVNEDDDFHNLMFWSLLFYAVFTHWYFFLPFFSSFCCWILPFVFHLLLKHLKPHIKSVFRQSNESNFEVTLRAKTNECIPIFPEKRPNSDYFLKQ